MIGKNSPVELTGNDGSRSGAPSRTRVAELRRPRKRSAWREGRYLSLLAVALYFTGWFALTEDGLGVIETLKFPTPKMVVVAAWDFRATLIDDFFTSYARVLLGLTVGATAGVGVGMLMYFSKKVFYVLDPIIESLRPVPAIAMIPFFLLWFGITEKGKFLLVSLGVFAILVVSTYEAARNVSRIYVRAAESLGASRWQIFRFVISPGILPGLIGPFRVCVALSFTLVVAAEFMGADSGLGFRILQARKLFATDLIMVGVVLFGFMSALTDTAVRNGLRYLTRWAERSA